MNIKIIDYGLGNLNSVKNILKKIGYNDVAISNSALELNQADFFVLPGVGSFDSGILSLKSMEGFNVLKKKVIIDKTPILGICLGMQLLGIDSEEGKEKGLGWLNFSCKRFDSTQTRKVPHMGWNYVDLFDKDYLIKTSQRYYFVHSYYCPENTHNNSNEENSLKWMTTEYDGINFISAVKQDNIMGVQFHPEKSHKYGMDFFKNILDNYA